jgi:hypothetical protein
VFAEGRVLEFVYLLTIGIAMFYFSRQAKKGKVPHLSRLPALDAVDEAIGRCAEIGRPVFFTVGSADISDESAAPTLAGLTLMHYVVQQSAKYDVPLWVVNRYGSTHVAAQDVVKQGYLEAGRPDSYKPEQVLFLSSEQFAYGAGCAGIMHRERVGAVFLVGYFYAEALYLAESAASQDALSIAGTTTASQLPFFVAACDYTLIGEEIYAISAYLSRDPSQLGMVKGGDVSKLIACIVMAIGALSATFGQNAIKSILTR